MKTQLTQIVIKMSWEEYKTMMSALSAMKGMVDNVSLENLYKRLYTEYKEERIDYSLAP
jgi:hypothetical protein